MILIRNHELDELKEAADIILDEVGLDFETAVKVMLKRIIKEKNAMFLFDKSGRSIRENSDFTNKPTISAPITPQFEEEQYEPQSAKYEPQSAKYEPQNSMTKSKAIFLFRQKGIDLSGKTTFASKNIAANNYWANPLFSYLDEKWNLILNDWERRQLHLFIIPAGQMPNYTLVGRNDKAETIDLQILYDDSTFTDMRSKFSFLRFYHSTIKY